MKLNSSDLNICPNTSPIHKPSSSALNLEYDNRPFTSDLLTDSTLSCGIEIVESNLANEPISQNQSVIQDNNCEVQQENIPSNPKNERSSTASFIQNNLSAERVDADKSLSNNENSEKLKRNCLGFKDYLALRSFTARSDSSKLINDAEETKPRSSSGLTENVSINNIWGNISSQNPCNDLESRFLLNNSLLPSSSSIADGQKDRISNALSKYNRLFDYFCSLFNHGIINMVLLGIIVYLIFFQKDKLEILQPEQTRNLCTLETSKIQYLPELFHYGFFKTKITNEDNFLIDNDKCTSFKQAGAILITLSFNCSYFVKSIAIYHPNRANRYSAIKNFSIEPFLFNGSMDIRKFIYQNEGYEEFEVNESMDKINIAISDNYGSDYTSLYRLYIFGTGGRDISFIYNLNIVYLRLFIQWFRDNMPNKPRMAKNIDKTNLKRLAIINEELCKPEKCNQECRRSCPVNRIGKLCIEVDKKAHISESLCIGCSACEKKCPFHAISIINIPTNIDKDCSHRYGPNSFKLHRLPVPRPGKILGLVGTNGIGKSTALKILSGKIKPNLGNFENEPEWQDILKNCRGSELHGYFTKLLENKLTTSNKIQYIDKIPRILEKRYKKDSLTVEFVLNIMDGRKMREYYTNKFELDCIMNRNLRDLSGGELQRLSLALACMQEAEVYVFDEPTSFLDVKQRLTAAREIRKIAENTDKYVIVVEHDLAILDLMSDYGCVLYGQSGAYGVISAPFAIKAAINIFLDGFIPTENMRFRETALKFNIQDAEELGKGEKMQFSYPACSKTYVNASKNISGELVKSVEKMLIKDPAKNSNLDRDKGLVSKNSFKLEVSGGTFSNSEITVFLGENGMGKTTLVNLLAGLITDDTGFTVSSTSSISLKPQKILPKFRGSVRDLLNLKMKARFMDQSFQTEVIKPLRIDYLFDCDISSLSGGELQRIAIILCLGKDADIYLFDEPAAFLDSDQRIIISKIIKKFIYSKKKSAFIVEHDLVVATYLADRVVVFEGVPGVHSLASEPLDVRTGMNRFLKTLDVTFRRDSTNYRPRVNKPDSSKDREQKKSNSYFFT